MIVSKENHRARSQSIARSCIGIAKHLGLTILDNTVDGTFAIKAALEDEDELWINRNDIDHDVFDNFIRMCLSYTTRGSNRVPHSRVMIKVLCPNCNNCIMTPKQFRLNTIDCDKDTFVICNNCGEIMQLTERMHIIE